MTCDQELHHLGTALSDVAPSKAKKSVRGCLNSFFCQTSFCHKPAAVGSRSVGPGRPWKVLVTPRNLCAFPVGRVPSRGASVGFPNKTPSLLLQLSPVKRLSVVLPKCCRVALCCVP